jgi:hypothetical protein
MSTMTTTVGRTYPAAAGWPVTAWMPLVVLPVITRLLTASVITRLLTASTPRWMQMWGLAVSIYGGLKWLTFAVSPAVRDATTTKAIGYLFLWTGMDAGAFFRRAGQTLQMRWTEWVWSVGQIAVGAWMIVGVAPRLVPAYPLIAGWLTMFGVVSVLHFGVSHLLSLGWRAVGVNARHIMHKPLLATSLADFWGRRWNLAFRDVAHRFILKPLTGVVGCSWAMMAVFLVSGLVHDAVISLSAGGGWGWPTLYFLIQGAAMWFERSRVARLIGLGHGLIGWMFAAAVIVGPVGMLFHRPFIERVVLPMLFSITGAIS